MKSSKVSYYKVWNFLLYLRYGFLLSATAGLLSLTSCQNQKKPSVLIIALDHLSFNSFSCADDKSSSASGLSILCNEAIRFTHAYTTSVQPAAALASLLTGQYPFEHQLHRSFDRVNSKSIMIQELANDKGYRTSFFSGSPNVLRKTGLAKGFDLFDDYSFLDKKNYFLSFTHQTDNFLNWLAENKEPFFSVIYNSELESFGDEEFDISALERLDDKFSLFFSQLKKNNQWENNYIIVIGLQGKSDYNRINETAFSSLHSENTNITFFIKPPRQKGDEGVHWKVDSVISLADIGYSLINTLSDNFVVASNLMFPIIDISPLWKKNISTELESLKVDRRILLESCNTWRQNIETRFAIIYKNLFYIEQKSNEELFNILNDGLETIDISNSANENQINFKEENKNNLKFIRQNNQNRWLNFNSNSATWKTLNREYWLKTNNRSEILDAEYIRFKKEKVSHPLTALMIQQYALKNKFDQLKELGLKTDIFKLTNEKEFFFEDAKKYSLNLSLENIWGLDAFEKDWTLAPSH